MRSLRRSGPIVVPCTSRVKSTTPNAMTCSSSRSGPIDAGRLSASARQMAPAALPSSSHETSGKEQARPSDCRTTPIHRRQQRVPSTHRQWTKQQDASSLSAPVHRLAGQSRGTPWSWRGTLRSPRSCSSTTLVVGLMPPGARLPTIKPAATTASTPLTCRCSATK